MPEGLVTDTLVFRATDFAPDLFFLCTLQGHEAVSQPYEFRVTLQMAGLLDGGDIDKLLTRPVYVAFGIDETDKIHGVVRAIEIAPHPDGTNSRIAVTVVPRLWYLGQTRRSRVFQDVTIPEIVKAVLVDAGFEDGADFSLHVTGAHPKRAYTVQYQETDLQFVSRLMEHDGMFYFFDHTGEVEKLVIGDANASFEPAAGYETLPFAPLGGVVDTGNSVTAIQQFVQTVPRLAYVRDYNHEMPGKVVMNDRKVAVDEAGWPVDRAGHGVQITDDEHVPDTAQANRIAQLRSEELLVRKHRFAGTTTLRALRAGHKFTLEGHTAPGFDKAYVVVELEHSCDQEAQGVAAVDGDAPADDSTVNGYKNEFVAIPASVTYRPARLTPKPKIQGAIYARIDGASTSTAAPIDDKGRYRVVLPFDTIAEVGKGSASHPMRMAQPYSGPGYGMHLPLHQGAEVLIVHIDGDPDRPVIAATLPNPTMPNPLVSPFGTRAVIQTRSAVRIEFDDDA